MEKELEGTTAASRLQSVSLNDWVRILEILREKIPRQSFDTWLKPTRFIGFEGKSLLVRVPSVDFLYIKDRYTDLLQESLLRLKLDCEIVFVPSDSEEAKENERQSQPTPSSPRSSKSKRPESGPAELNPQYSFDSFVVGDGSKFAFTAAHAIVERPGLTYNPLFLYGGSGTGKTHLLHAIGNEFTWKHPRASVLYATGEKFVSEMIESLRDKTMRVFRQRVRTVDVLLMDDIQFLSGKTRLQEEFLHTFDALLQRKRQVVIACDQSPRELTGLDEKLHSRLEAGLVADLQVPNFETRVGILHKKAAQEKITLPTDVALFIATHARANTRELEGALTRLIAWSSSQGLSVNIETAQTCLKHLLGTRAKMLKIGTVATAVAKHYHLPVTALKQEKSRSLAEPRHLAMYLAQQLTHASLSEIGRYFGGRHHTTVLYSIHKIEKLIKVDPIMRDTVEVLSTSLGHN
ncbi:chromosomal replication initiator protein DnaA [Edaphobacter modestus]|uniref:Chromosomal replication initiator protein DnaA n=1 Tax=Edaphobacter modestus TaxID=388466 RepID=A0A4Q7XZQ2_9BACT|nr:chromosomal replication initiator protein DnaA [Edaphobacter modestus]RZU29043.1 chromosomal replication initiator protein DnaA [Edaphobacter modestus]